MTALTADREDNARIGPIVDYDYPVAAGAVIYQGALVMLNATGQAVPGAVATGQTAVGVATEARDNTGGADGDLRVPVAAGTWKFKNDVGGADEIDSGSEGATVYIHDDQTVSLTDGAATKSAAGVAVQLDDDSVADSDVFVRIGPDVQPA